MNAKIAEQIKSTAERIEVALRSTHSLKLEEGLDPQITDDRNKLRQRYDEVKKTNGFTESASICKIEFIIDMLTELVSETNQLILPVLRDSIEPPRSQ